MAKMKKTTKADQPGSGSNNISSSVDELLLAALEKGGDSFETGRYLVTFKEEAIKEGIQSLGAQGMRVADARDFKDQAATLEAASGSDAFVFPEIGVALISGNAAKERSMSALSDVTSDSAIASIDPEYFVFANNLYNQFLQTGHAEEAGTVNEFLRGFLTATQTIAQEIGDAGQVKYGSDEDAMVLGATWGLNACKVPPSLRSGAGIKVAVLDTGFDIGHPDFAGRPIVTATFVGQPVQDLHSHGTHCIGTACGPKAPAGAIPRYGIAYLSLIYAGKVLSNAGGSVGASVLSGMNWAIANRCEVISMSLGGPGGVQPSYTAAGQAALNAGCLIIAAAGNDYGAPTGYPANSPTIMAVSSLDSNLKLSNFSNKGKIDIAGPGRDVYSSVPRPTRYGTKSGTSMATPHVAGCAALWAQTSPNLRGMALWQKLKATAKILPLPASQVGAGLVQAP